MSKHGPKVAVGYEIRNGQSVKVVTYADGYTTVRPQGNKS